MIRLLVGIRMLVCKRANGFSKSFILILRFCDDRKSKKKRPCGRREA